MFQNKFKTVLFFLLSGMVYSQGVVEYDIVYPINFSVYDSSNNTLRKPLEISGTKRSSPEELVQAYFFATDSISLKNLFLDKSEYSPKKQKHFDATKNLDYNNNFVTLLHKFSYEHDGSQMSYINFIFKYENIDFTMPTNLSCIKKDNKWFIYKIGNQINIGHILLAFKSCKISQLINGENLNDLKTNNLILSTKTSNNILDINKLFLESQKFNESEKLFFTMKKNNECDSNDNQNKLINKKVFSSFLWQLIEFEKFEDSKNKEKLNLINSLKTNVNDSICLDSRLSVKFDNKLYSILKFKNCLNDKFLSKTFSNELPQQVEELFFIFKNLNTKFISDLSSQSLSNKNTTFKQIFEKTRGQFNALNTSKLFNLLKSNRLIFKDFLVQ